MLGENLNVCPNESAKHLQVMNDLQTLVQAPGTVNANGLAAVVAD